MNAEPSTLDLPPVAALLQRSEPGRPLPWRWGILTLMVITVFLLNRVDPSAGNRDLVLAFTFSLILLGLVIFSLLSARNVARAQRTELAQLQRADELIQTRRWPEAASLLLALLARPMRTQAARVQALIFFVTVLMRYHRFVEAIEINDYILQNFPIDPISRHGLRVGRAMAMLREDHLVDADRALGELRRESADKSAGLSLLEIYRDVKTGHASEAVALFTDRRQSMRQQLGHRLGDAFALIARAYDMLGEDQHAAQHWQWATLLVPSVELARRYPELSAIIGKYPPALTPVGGVA